MRGVAIVRAILWGIIAAVVGLLIGFSGILPGTGFQAPVSVGRAQIGGPFSLTSHKGERYDNARLAGKPYLVFLGFAHCPDICPTTLFELTDMMDELGRDADRFTPLFITVDPERDTEQILREYMSAFDERIVALRGTLAETETAAKAFAAYFAKVPTDNGGYTMDHTAGVILMDANGQFAGTLDMDEPRDTRLAKLRNLAKTDFPG